MGVGAVLVLALAVVSVLSFPSIGAAGPSADPVLRAWVPTPDGSDGYSIVGGRDSVTVQANPGNRGGNLRTVIWGEDAPELRDTTECATWDRASSDSAQEGMAVRIASLPDGEPTAVTVTKNVYAGAPWLFNVHVWRGPGLGRQIGEFDLHSVFRDTRAGRVVRPLPWRMCVRTRGDRLDLLVWPLAGPAPRWGDPRYGGTLRLPPSVAPRGASGWFAGHLGPGGSVAYTDLHGVLPSGSDSDRAAVGAGVGAVVVTG
nr:hypothetical protein [Actinomycetota bacterium]